MCVTADRPDPPKRGMGYLFSCPYESYERKNAMTEQPDTSQGWCCDCRTWSEHIHEGCNCSLPQRTSIKNIPPEGQHANRFRLGHFLSPYTRPTCTATP